MAFDDLDLEFEDEEEAKKKKSDAVQVDVDLEFHLPENAQRRPPRPGGPPSGPPPLGEVRKIQEGRPPVRRPPGTVPARPDSLPRIQGATALKESPIPDLESQEVVELREKARKAEFDADVRVAIAEFKTELLSELLSDIKLMDHQIQNLLVRINAKHPDLKQELLLIKKILADFTAKKRK